MPNPKQNSHSTNTLIEEHLTRTLKYAKRHNQKMAFMYLDMDDFSLINEQHGYAAGDQILAHIEMQIKDSIRATDILHSTFSNTVISRLAGDKFALLLCDIKYPSNAGVVAERILKSIKRPFDLGENSVKTGVSIGIACYPFAGTTPESLQKAAVIATYKAKEKGKNNFQYYSDKLNTDHHRYLLVETGLKEAIKNNELFIEYQPIISLETNKTIACEALCRWHHQELGVIPPDEFIEIAENTTLIKDLGKWVFKKVLEDFRTVDPILLSNLEIHINLSTQQLETEEWTNIAKQSLIDSPLKAHQIIFELTETSLMLDEVLIEKQVSDLHKIGYQISIDDFGTGYSSLGRLKDLPISSIKIDKTFVDRIGHNENSEIILKSMINLARNLGMKAIAEGVETKKQFLFLSESNCDDIQGYYFSKALSLEQLITYIKKGSPHASE